MNALPTPYFAVGTGLHRVIVYRWPDAVAEYAAMIGRGEEATVIQTHRNLVRCDVTAEASADWFGDDESEWLEAAE